jgi:hypothetical protein
MDGTHYTQKWLALTVGLEAWKQNFYCTGPCNFLGFLKIKQRGGGGTYIGQKHTHNFSLTLSFAYQLCWNREKNNDSSGGGKITFGELRVRRTEWTDYQEKETHNSRFLFFSFFGMSTNEGL